MKKFIASTVFLFLGLTSLAQTPDQSSILFSSKELDAAFTLTRPDLNHLDISGRSGTLDPAPALKFLGLNTMNFDLNLTAIADIVDLEFNHLQNKTFQVQFQNDGIHVTIPIVDQDQAIQSSLGSISFSGVAVEGVIGMTSQNNGEQIFDVASVKVTGNLSGTGILRSKFILKNAKNLLIKVMTKQLNTALENSIIQNAIKGGLVTWSKFYTGADFHSVIPGSIQIDENGIHYSAQP